MEYIATILHCTGAGLSGDYELKGWAIISNKIPECENEVQ
jgi:hypothetical protein